jgi:hypothetical protein
MFLLLVMCNCGSPDESSLAISKGPLSGKIDGQSWSIATADCVPSPVGSQTLYTITLSPTAFSACKDRPSMTRENHVILLEFFDTPGNYTVGDKTMFADFGTMEPKRGRLRIDTITPTTLTGGANLFGNTDNNLDGEFQATICP